MTSRAVLNRERLSRDIIVVGASAGGVEAILQLLERLPPGLPAVVAIVLHRSRYQETRLPWVLERRAHLPVIEPEDGTPATPGTIYVAPRDLHMVFEGDAIRLSQGPREHRTRPAIDPLFRSAAARYGPRVAGVLLSGMGADGVPGLIDIKAAGGLSIVQDPREAMHPTMPRNAIADDDVDAVLPLHEIASVLVTIAEGGSVGEREPPAAAHRTP